MFDQEGTETRRPVGGASKEIESNWDNLSPISFCFYASGDY